MKKNLIIFFSLFIISLISFTSCEPFIENKITIKNEADGTVWLNLKAKLHEIAPGDVLVLNDFDRGEYEFETIYEVPFGVTSSSTEGEVAGTMNLIGGTEIFLIYTSTVSVSGSNSTYTLFGSMTSSDDVNRINPFDNGEGQ